MTTPAKPARVVSAIRSAIDFRNACLDAGVRIPVGVDPGDVLRLALPTAEALEELVEVAQLAGDALERPADYNRLHVASDLRDALRRVREAS